MVMNWITHKSGRQPAWETGEIGHLISSALTEMPEKGGPSKPAPPSSWSKGFCIWEMIHWSQLKPSFFPITQEKDSKQLQASLKKARDNCQTWFWLVMLPDSRRDNGWNTSLARPGIYKHICLYSQCAPPPQDLGAVKSSFPAPKRWEGALIMLHLPLSHLKLIHGELCCCLAKGCWRNNI